MTEAYPLQWPQARPRTKTRKRASFGIPIRGSEDMHIEHYRIIAAGSLKDIEKLALPVSPGEIMELFIEERHSSSPENGIARLHGYVINVTGAGEKAGQVVRAEITEVCRTFARATPIAAARKKRRRSWAGLAKRK